MTNWFFSAIVAFCILGLFYLTGTQLNFEFKHYVLLSIIGLISWFGIGCALNQKPDIETIDSETRHETRQTETPIITSDQDQVEQNNPQYLHDAVLELTKQLRLKEKEIDLVRAKLSEREFRRSLSRISSINDTLGYILKSVEDKKMSTADALEHLRLEISSAISDLGIDYYNIIPGTPISSLPYGSFAIINIYSDAPSGLAGTVKDVINSALCVRDEKNELHFISPSKINVYKL
jgi:hypothetical protein